MARHGHGADSSAVGECALHVRSTQREMLDFPQDGTIWLTGSVPTYRSSSVVVNDGSYSLQSVVVNGANIVDSGRQRFTPVKAPTVAFTGQLHNLTVAANDAVYGDAVGTAAVVTYPDGTVRTVPFGSDHTATLSNLPRGTYKVSVGGAGGIVLEEQVGLSRDKVLTVGVLTVGDLTTIAVAGGGFAPPLPFVGGGPVQG